MGRPDHKDLITRDDNSKNIYYPSDTNLSTKITLPCCQAGNIVQSCKRFMVIHRPFLLFVP